MRLNAKLFFALECIYVSFFLFSEYLVENYESSCRMRAFGFSSHTLFQELEQHLGCITQVEHKSHDDLAALMIAKDTFGSVVSKVILNVAYTLET